MPDKIIRSKEITKELLATYKCLKNASGWLSVSEIREETNLPKGTINRHTQYLVEIQIIEVVKSMTFYLYRFSKDAEKLEIQQQFERLLAIFEKI